MCRSRNFWCSLNTLDAGDTFLFALLCLDVILTFIFCIPFVVELHESDFACTGSFSSCVLLVVGANSFSNRFFISSFLCVPEVCRCCSSDLFFGVFLDPWLVVFKCGSDRLKGL